MSTETLGQRLRKLRDASGMSQHRLGVEAGITAQTVHMVETGKRHFQRDTAERVARALDTTPEYLLFGIEPTYTGELPPVDVYLKQAAGLGDEDVALVTDLVRRLAETREPYETEEPDVSNLAAHPVDEETREEKRFSESWTDEEAP